MSTYAIGDVQGCFDDLKRLLIKLDYDPDRDKLWFVGDLVNRGSKNVQTLRFVRDLGDNAITVLGNHDLHLLAVAYGYRKHKPLKDTFEDVLEARDSESLIDWLRHRPLLHHDEDLGFTMIHAGLPPQWDLETAKRCAEEMQEVLRGKKIKKFLKHMYGNKPNDWSQDLQKWDRLRFITNSFTRMRYCTEEGVQDFKENGPLGTQPEHLHPWFRIKNRRNKDLKLIFGHWATLGHIEDDNIFSLDSACVWGHGLTAMKLGETPEYFQIRCKGARFPEKELSRMSAV